MVNNICIKCGKCFHHPSKLKKHYERKTPCFSMEEKRTQKNPIQFWK